MELSRIYSYSEIGSIERTLGLSFLAMQKFHDSRDIFFLNRTLRISHASLRWVNTVTVHTVSSPGLIN